MTTAKSPRKNLDRLLELLADEVQAKSDAEILEASLEEGGDVTRRAQELRDLLNAQVARARGLREKGVTTVLDAPTPLPYLSDSPEDNLPTSGGETSLVNWTSRSVKSFAQGRDPLKVMTDCVDSIVVKALERGWDGPPYDPFKLAELLSIEVAPRADISEARIVKGRRDNFLIEFNPQLPSSRIRFSIAHEIAHTFFSDCLERARYRARRAEYANDDWQLEMLCNVGAAEILMPPGSFASLREEGFDIVRLMELRKQLEVSTEALLMRVTKLAKSQIACFVASPRNGHLRADYAVFSHVWQAKRIRLPQDTLAHRCSAIGSIAKGHETWQLGGQDFELDVQVVGLPAYKGQEQIRVAGLIRPRAQQRAVAPDVEYLEGDALKPVGHGPKVIAHIVNDATPRWGGSGFAAAMKHRWPDVQEQFKAWANSSAGALRLGGLHIATREENLWIASMVAQHGYGPSDRPRIRYEPLERCLAAVAELAQQKRATVHMPKIGSGYGRGNWGVIEELIERLICSRGIRAFVYQLPKGLSPKGGNA